MATFAVGDIQGCYSEFRTLLEKLDFQPNLDQLWLTGDLVNRGPQSLEVLKYLRDLGSSVISVLGNHDLHLIAQAMNKCNPKSAEKDLQPILASRDKIDLIEWLRHLPLLFFDANYQTILVHAGLHPHWDLLESQQYACEVEELLQGSSAQQFLKVMYGDMPNKWNKNLSGYDRYRIIINCLTRIRYVGSDIELDFVAKNHPRESKNATLIPWFETNNRANQDYRIIFGHWSNLKFYSGNNIICLDGGCVFGGVLIAVDIDQPSTPITVGASKNYCPISKLEQGYVGDTGN
jgi:bis(5'-nucleosyl)-tetraphosphatase (symmetrical)